MKRKIGILILGLIMAVSGIVLIPLGVENASAETWTQTTNSDFESGERAFVDVMNDAMQLARGLNRLWYGLGEAASDYFGFSVSGAGDVNGDGYDDLIVGAYGNDDAWSEAGEVYVYYGSASGPSAVPDWSDQGEAADDAFGYSISGAGDVNGDGYDDIIVGADRNDDAGNLAGKAYVYFGSASGPSATPDWLDVGEAAGDYFGRSVSGAGDVNSDGYDDIIVGAPFNDSAGNNAGKAYVYFGSASGPSATPDWSDEGEAPDNYFGYSVSGAGDINDDGYDDIIAGAYGNDDGGNVAGEAYVYFGSASGPSATPDWSDQGEADWDIFGYSVSGAGDVNCDGYDDIIVGAQYNDDAGGDAGKAYVYYGSASGPSATPDWSDQGEYANDWFGVSVSGAGDVNRDGYDDIIVAAYGNDDAGSEAGEAYVYFGSASGPSATPDWSNRGEAAWDYFGYSVSSAGDVNGNGYDDIIVGAYGNDDIASAAGKAYLFSVSPFNIYQSWYDQGEASSDQFGYSVSGAGDVDGNGYDDIIVGAPYNDGAGSSRGGVYVYYGSASGLSATPDWSDEGEADWDLFGYSVSGAGDVNRDGYDDIIVGALLNDDAGSEAGKVYVYYGSATGPSATPDWSDEGEAAMDYFGFQVFGAGDVNCDGYDDIMVGAPYNDSVVGNEGKAYVYYGSASGPSATPDWSDQGEAADDRFGFSVSDAGDVNCDGYDDIIVGAPYNDDAGNQAGEAYVYYGSASGPSVTPDWWDQGEYTGDYFGISVSSAGDVNCDDYDDIIVGAYYNDSGGSNAGKAYVYYGSGGGPSATPDWLDEGETAGDYFGYSVSGAGDVNSDGYADIIVGAYGNDGAGLLAGEAYVYYGSASGPSVTPDWSDQGEAMGDNFGRSVSGAGDVNRDGYDDIIVGALYNDDAGNNAGEAYVYCTAQYAERGRFISDTFSVGGIRNVEWMSIDWRPFTQPDETSVKFQIATNEDGMTWEFRGPDGTEDTFYTNPHGQEIFGGEEGRFLKVRIYLTTTIGSRTPIIEEFSINFVQYDTPFVVVTSPNGGEDWIKGAHYPITWTAEGNFNSTPVCIYYSTDNGASWSAIATWIANTGYYNWTVPSVTTASALIRINVTNIYGDEVSDTSDASFAIDPPPPIGGGITSPNANTVWGQGEHAILWSLDSAVSSITLEYTLDGQNWTEIGSELPSTNSYTWDIPAEVNSKNARIRLKALDMFDSVHTFLSGTFTIDTEAPVISHEPIAEGTVGEAIAFEATASDNFEVSSFTLYYSEGSGFAPISMSEESGVYRASVVPTAEGTMQYYIRVSDGANFVETDIYDINIKETQDTSSGDYKDTGIWDLGIGLILGALSLVIISVIASVFITYMIIKRKFLQDTNVKDDTEKFDEGHPDQTNMERFS